MQQSALYTVLILGKMEYIAHYGTQKMHFWWEMW